MIKNRSFLIGLGIGITACALILQLALIGQGAAEGNEKNVLSRSDLEEQAKTLNLKVYDVEEEVMTEEEWTELKAEGVLSETESGVSTDSPEKPKEPQNEKPDEPKQPTSEKTTQPAESTDIVKYKVIQGATLNDVANHLSSLHVIQDLDAFLKEANRQKINRKIQTGTYEFEQNESTSSIIKKITSAP